MPYISIIIPVYNSGNTLTATLESIVSQSYPYYELLLIDGASTDNTLEIIKEYHKEDNRIRWISERDKGVYDAMNKGIKMAEGEWLYFLGGDDQLFSSTTLEQVLGYPNVDSYSVLYGNVQIIGNTSWAKDGDVYDGPFNLQQLLNRNICHQSIFYRKDLIDKVGFYNTNYKLCADWDYNLRCRAVTEFLYLDQVVATFNAGGESTRSNTDEKFYAEFVENIVKYFDLTLFDPMINQPSFPFYSRVVQLQKEQHYVKYLMNKVKEKLFSLG